MTERFLTIRYSLYIYKLCTAKAENPEKYACNDLKEASELTEDIKQIFYEEYQKAFNEK
jgi:hypothetical protein